MAQPLAVNRMPELIVLDIWLTDDIDGKTYRNTTQSDVTDLGTLVIDPRPQYSKTVRDPGRPGRGWSSRLAAHTTLTAVETSLMPSGEAVYVQMVDGTRADAGEQ